MYLPVCGAAYLLAVNLVGFLLCWSDKRRARRGRWRISETALLLTGLCGGCFGLLLGMRLLRHKTKHLKFRLLVPLECVLWAVVAVHLLSALTFDRWVQYVEVDYASPRARTLDGYRIAFVTDTHAITAAELEEVVARINTYRPDLFLLGGDFPSQAGAPRRSMEILSRVRAADGIYGVEGNHDDYAELFAAMEEYGITPLSNSGVAVRDDLYLGGVEDLWNRSPDIAAAVGDAPQDGGFVVLLAHNPDVTMQQNTAGVDLILSGHTHGGQATFFGLYAPALAFGNGITAYGQRFRSGWAKSRDGADVYVGNGTGYIHGVPRVFARPQVIVLTLRYDEGRERQGDSQSRRGANP